MDAAWNVDSLNCELGLVYNSPILFVTWQHSITEDAPSFSIYHVVFDNYTPHWLSPIVMKNIHFSCNRLWFSNEYFDFYKKDQATESRDVHCL